MSVYNTTTIVNKVISSSLADVVYSRLFVVLIKSH